MPRRALHGAPGRDYLSRTVSTGRRTAATQHALPVNKDYKNRANLTDNYVGYDMSMKESRSMQWSLGIQRELIANTMLDVSYVGSRNLGLINSLNMNQASAGPGAIQPRRRLFAIDPNLQDVDYRTNWGASKYHSMQVNVRKRYSNGLTMGVAYTWSHNLTNTRQPNASTRPQNPNCSRCEWGNAPEDRRHTMVINHLYELPFGKGRSYLRQGPLSHIVGNWDLSGVWTMYSGTWTSPAQSGSISNANATGGAANSTERPDRIRNGNLPRGERTIDKWYDVGAFVAPQQFTFGNAALGILENPGYFGVDLGIHRNIPITERYHLAFRWEMFNSFNRANFGAPNATLGATTAGQISTTLPARIMQASLKFNF